MINVPSSFDPIFYRERYLDLAKMSDKEAQLHYNTYGCKEGRISSPFAVREALANHASQATKKLEIGPFCNPILLGHDVSYLDVLDEEQLRKRALEFGMDPARCPDRIHYVGGIEQVTERFDAVLSAHCIEHQPDLISHLNGVADILRPNGCYYLIIPNKLYCFDHFIAESTVAQVVEAHFDQRRLHKLGSVIEHMALTTHNDPGRHWRGDHGIPPGASDAKRVSNAVDYFVANQGGYIDVHAWYFTPNRFSQIIDTLFNLNLIRLRAVGVYDTPMDRQEFCAVLEPIT